MLCSASAGGLSALSLWKRGVEGAVELSAPSAALVVVVVVLVVPPGPSGGSTRRRLRRARPCCIASRRSFLPSETSQWRVSTSRIGLTASEA